MQLTLTNHSSYPRIGESPEYQRLRRTIARWEKGEKTEADRSAAEDRMTKLALSGPFFPGGISSAVAWVRCGYRVHHEEDYTVGGEVFLQSLHGACAIMIVAEGAVEIIGFQNNDLAFVIAQLNGFAVDIRGREVRRGFADFGDCKRGADECECEQCYQCIFHNL